MKRSYSTDLTDREWECLKPHIPPPNNRGRPRVHTTREILDAVFFYVLKSGCPWRLLPRDLEHLGKLSIAGSGDGAYRRDLGTA
jgi:putative transposase